MIESFVQSWDLFATTYLAGMLIAALLAMVGVVVVARDQIFIGAAVAEASTLGVAAALALGHGAAHDHDDALAHGFPAAMAVLFAVAASTLTMRRPKPGRDSRESLTGWVFLLCAAGAVLLVAQSPHSLNEVQRLLASTLISATWKDVTIFAAMTLAVAVVLTATHRTLLLLVVDGETAEALGVRVLRWNLAMAVVFGVVLGMALHVAGLIYVFGCLVLPAMLARNLCRRASSMFLVAPALALPLTLVGFVLANHHDVPPAHAIVALMAAALPLTWAIRRTH